MRAAGIRLCYAAAWLLLVVDISFSTAAYAGAGVWTSGGPYGGTTVALAINPSNPTTLYAGTDGGGVFKSTDSGGNWAAENTGLTNLRVRALAIDPGVLGTVYAGTYYGGVWQWTPAPPAQDFYTLTPCRIFDTRQVSGPTLGAPLTCGTAQSFTVAGKCGVPTSAKAVSLNLTGTGRKELEVRQVGNLEADKLYALAAHDLAAGQ